MIALVSALLFFSVCFAANQDSTFHEVSHFAPSNLTANSGFGYNVVLYEDWLVVSAVGTDSNQGSAYVYQCHSGSNCTQRMILKAQDGMANDTYGEGLALYEELLVIGAPGKDDQRGALYVYNCTSFSACQLASTLTLPDGEPDDYLGYYIVTNDYWVLAGAYGRNNNTGEGYLYNCEDATNCLLTSNLTVADAQPGDYVGISVGMDGWLAVLGADQANNQEGAAYAFNCSQPDNCSQIATFRPADDKNASAASTLNAYFGSLVYVNEGIAYIGAMDMNNETGAVYIYDCSKGSNCTWITTLVPENVTMGEQFGSYIVAYEGLLVVGSQLRNNGTGAVYVFDCTDITNCVQTNFLQPSDGMPGDEFGWALTVSDGTIAVGTSFKNDGKGEVWTFSNRQGTPSG